MSDMTFTVKDLVVAASVLGPVIVSALGIYNKMKHQDAKLCAMVDKLVTESRDIRDRVTEGHNRLNPIESRMGQLEGWIEAQKK